MLSQKCQDALNDQMRFEIYSAYIYKAMAAYFEAEDLKGFSNYFKVQTLEELAHSEKFFNYVCDAGGRARLHAIDEPRFDYSSALEAAEVSLEHERLVTARINKLSDLALEESDHATRIFLEWFVTEQLEEESNATTLIKKLKLVEGDGRGILMLDAELAQRVFVPPAP